MNPDELAELLKSVLRSMSVVAHAEFLELEATYWRAEAMRLRDILATIESAARSGQNDIVPPEPPIGTQFHNGATGERVFYRGDLGWYCGKDNCQNCPRDWPEVASQIAATDHRTLPGVTPMTAQR